MKKRLLIPILSLLMFSCQSNPSSTEISIPEEYVEYNISMNLNGGSLENVGIIKRNRNSITSLPVPSKDKAVFLGWYDSLDDLENVISFPFSLPYNGYVFYAHYTNYKVTFITQDNKTLETKYVPIGKSTTPYIGQSLIDHFTYYFEDKTNPLNGVTFDFNTKIYSDITLMAISTK